MNGVSASPVTKLYHFTLYSYGDAFRDAAARLERTIDIEIVTVLSTKRGSFDELSFAHRARELKRRWRRRGAIVDVRDVDGFVARCVAPGAVGVVTGFDQIFSVKAVGAFVSIVNFHPSILPRYRGARPTHQVLRAGETSTGFTIHALTAEVDGGPILYQEVVDIAGLRTVGQIDAVLLAPQVRAFEVWIRHLRSGRAWEPTTVDERRVYAAREREGAIALA